MMHYPYMNMNVFKDGNNHVLIEEKIDENYHYLDLHECKYIKVSEEVKQKDLLKLDGLDKRFALGIYRHWKKGRSSDYIRERAKKNFPLRRIQNHYKLPENIKPNSFIDKPLKITKKKNSNKSQQLRISPENQRKEEIENFIERRNIKKLTHFTHIQNLKSIMKRGLLSRTEVERIAEKELVKINDDQRIDNRKEAICVNIEFPNYKTFTTFHEGNHKDWVVISLDPEILWKYDCAFCHTNAASNECRFININERKKVEALRRLFEDFNDMKRQDLNIPDSFPTDPQAEVLVFERIPVEDFKKIYFNNIDTMIYYQTLFSDQPADLFGCERDYFYDRENWKNNQVNELEFIEDDNDICHFPW